MRGFIQQLFVPIGEGLTFNFQSFIMEPTN